VQGNWIEEKISEDVNNSAHKDNSLAAVDIEEEHDVPINRYSLKNILTSTLLFQKST
jgi:hypothetical protein